MGVYIGAQMHANYSNPTSKCFAMYLS